jgi:hypothetical protein
MEAERAMSSVGKYRRCGACGHPDRPHFTENAGLPLPLLIRTRYSIHPKVRVTAFFQPA